MRLCQRLFQDRQLPAGRRLPSCCRRCRLLRGRRAALLGGSAAAAAAAVAVLGAQLEQGLHLYAQPVEYLSRNRAPLASAYCLRHCCPAAGAGAITCARAVCVGACGVGWR